jgi:anti-sigma B factor antagonist
MTDPAPPTTAGSSRDQLDVAIDRPSVGVAVLRVRGEIDTLTADTFAAAVTELLSARDQTLVVDLTGVTFLASTGLAVLIEAARKAEVRPHRLRLVAPGRAVRRPLEITGTDRLFEIHPDVSAATTGTD